MNSETLWLLSMANHPTSVPLCEPEIQWPFRPHAHHNIIYRINYTTSSLNSPWTLTDCPNELLKFSHFGLEFWDRSNGRSRPQTNSIIKKTLKQNVTSSMIKPLPHGVCQKSPKLVPTRSPRRVEQLSFLARRNPTVRSSRILERSCTLSH